MMTEAEWAELKERRVASILTSIETLRLNAEPTLRRYRFGVLKGRISELRILGLITSNEAMALGQATDLARKEAHEASPDVAQRY